MNVHLSGVPAPFYNESLASWIQRVCQVYDLTFSRFHEIFATSGGLDADLCLTSEQLPGIERICGFQPQDVSLFRHCFCRLKDQPNLQRLLLHHARDGYTYRYCPECWANDRPPYLRLEWRFRNCEYCFVHRHKLETSCHSCGTALPTHRSLMGGTRKPPPVSHMATCLYCRADLRSVLPNEINCEAEVVKKIAFQKAVISAVLHGYFLVQPFSTRRSLNQMLTLMEGVGLEPPDKKSTAILAQFDADDRSMLLDVLNAAVRGVKWLRPGHPRRRRMARESFGFWQENDNLTAGEWLLPYKTTASKKN
jgi:hypothetical protein